MQSILIRGSVVRGAILTAILGVMAVSPDCLTAAHAADSPSPTVIESRVTASPESEWVSLDAVLIRLNPYGAAFKRADTTLRKDQIREEAVNTASTILAGKQMTIRGRLSDVRMKSDDTAVLSLSALDQGAYEKKTDKNLTVSVAGPIRIAMTESEAAALSKGMILDLAGAVTFREGVLPLLDALTAPASVVRIQLRGDPQSLGTIDLADIRWRAFPAPRGKP